MADLTEIEKTLKLIMKMKESSGLNNYRVTKERVDPQSQSALKPTQKPKLAAQKKHQQKHKKKQITKQNENHAIPSVERQIPQAKNKKIIDPGFWECPLCKEICRITDADRHYRFDHPAESYRMHLLEQQMTPKVPRVKLIFGASPGSGKRS
jgi:hypothetical protein